MRHIKIVVPTNKTSCNLYRPTDNSIYFPEIEESPSNLITYIIDLIFSDRGIECELIDIVTYSPIIITLFNFYDEITEKFLLPERDFTYSIVSYNGQEETDYTNKPNMIIKEITEVLNDILWE